MNTTHLSSLTDEEFQNLRNAVEKERQNRGAFYKSDTNTLSKLKDLYYQEFLDAGANEQGAWNACKLMETAVFRLADICTKNYKIRHRKKAWDDIYIPENRGGAVVQVDRDMYQATCDNIIEAMMNARKR